MEWQDIDKEEEVGLCVSAYLWCPSVPYYPFVGMEKVCAKRSSSLLGPRILSKYEVQISKRDSRHTNIG